MASIIMWELTESFTPATNRELVSTVPVVVGDPNAVTIKPANFNRFYPLQKQRSVYERSAFPVSELPWPIGSRFSGDWPDCGLPPLQ